MNGARVWARNDRVEKQNFGGSGFCYVTVPGWDIVGNDFSAVVGIMVDVLPIKI